MRLIDAEKLIEKYPQASGLKLVIENAPTVYNVDKVVEELEKEKFEVPDCRFDVDLNTTIDMAIDIVKRGGVE